MKVDPAKIIRTGIWDKQYSMTDVIIDLCDVQGFNTVFDDDDSVVMQNSEYYAVLTTRKDGRIESAYYRR
jgi:hypothetical protein